MRFFRGIAVPAAEAQNTIATIQSIGLVSSPGRREMKYEHPGDIEALYSKPDLLRKDTRPDVHSVPAVCACGDEFGGLYYACSHNLTATNDTPLLIEFNADISAVTVDGNDFLYNVFQSGNRQLARSVLERCFGEAVLRYADQAWASKIPLYRTAQCDLAIYDPDVIQAHHANDVVLAGRHSTIFRSAFTIKLPVKPEFIVNVSSPSPDQDFPQPDVCFKALLL